MPLGKPDNPSFLFIAYPFMVFLFDQRNDRALEPEYCVQTKETEDTCKQPLHKGVHCINPKSLLRIVGFRMRVVGSKARICVLVAFGASLNQVIFIYRRGRITCRQVTMRGMAIGTGRRRFIAECGRLPMKRVAIGWRLFFVATAAFINHLEVEITY